MSDFDRYSLTIARWLTRVYDTASPAGNPTTPGDATPAGSDPHYTLNRKEPPIALTKAAGRLLAKCFPVDGIRYARAGVVLTELRDVDGTMPLSLFREEFEGRGVGRALDEITRKLGRDAVGVGLGGLKVPAEWEMKRAMPSKRATTHWDELPVAVS